MATSVIVKPRVSTVSKYTIPAHLRASNPQLVKFLEYYYRFLEQSGNPLDLLQNMLEYRDIDSSSALFADIIIKQFLKLVPPTAIVDKALLVKHIREFFQARGSFPSFEFIINALFGEKVRQDWQSKYVLRASDNKYSRNARVAINSEDDLTLCVGSYLVQTEPTQASGLIESANSYDLASGTVWDIELNDKTVNGSFVVGGSVKALHSSIDRTFFEVENYYPVYELTNQKLTVQITKDLDFAGLVIREPDLPNGRAVVVSEDSRFNTADGSYVVLNLSEIDHFLSYSLQLEQGGGVLQQEFGDALYQDQHQFPDSEVYFISKFLEGTSFTKLDYGYGKVNPIIGALEIEDTGAMYQPGQMLQFTGDSGQGAEAHISEVTAGRVDEILVAKKGYGYSVGDPVIFDNSNTEGYGMSAVVKTIDGINAMAHGIYELEGLTWSNTGTGYAVGDVLEVIGGTRLKTSNPARISVTSVNSSWALTSINVLSGGAGYTYTKVSLVDALNNIVSTFGASATVTAGVITSVAITATPTITSAAYSAIINGRGATATATLSSGSVNATFVTSGGVNYVDPVVDVMGDGRGAVLIPSIDANGVITGLSIAKAGMEYTTITLTIRERHGSGAILQPVIADQNLGTGTITGYTITDRGDYLTLPESTYSQNFIDSTGIAAVSSFPSPTVEWNFLTKSFNPIAGSANLTYSRPTGSATRVNEQGTIESVSLDTPRFDYDPKTLQPRGLLREAAVTNRALRSDDYGNATWAKTDITVASDNTQSPMTGVNADKLTQGTAGTAVINQSSILMTANGRQANSIFAKYNNCQWIHLKFYDTVTPANFIEAWFDVQNGVVGNTGAGGTATLDYAQIEDWGNANNGGGWFRCALVGPINNSVTTGTYEFSQVTGNGSTTPANNAANWFFGSQSEQNSRQHTSYVPTTTAAIGRAKDVITDTVLSWFNASEGTIVMDAAYIAPQTSTFRAFNLSDGTDNNRIEIELTQTPSVQPVVTNGGVTQASFVDNGTPTILVPFTTAFGYKLNDFAGSLNGSTIKTDVAGTVPTGITTLTIGENGAGAAGGSFWIRRMAYYNTKLSNSNIVLASTGFRNVSLPTLAGKLLQEDGGVLLQENQDLILVGGSSKKDATASLTFRVKSVSLDDAGTGYRQVLAQTVGGRGEGAILIPQVFDGVIRAPISVDAGGSGYTYAQVLVSGHGVGARMTATVSGGAVTGIVVNDGGVGYDGTLDILSGGSSILKIIGDGTGATAHVTSVTNGVIKNVQVVSGGSGYPKNATVSDTPSAGGSLAGTFSLSIDDTGRITQVNITDGGYGYTSDTLFRLLTEAGDILVTSTDTLTLDKTTDQMLVSAGSPATFLATTSGTGKLMTVSVSDGGKNYIDPSEVTPLTLTVVGIGTGAIVKPIISAGQIIAASVLKSGTGYDNTTTINVTGGAGSGASLTPVIYGGRVVSVIVNSTGTGYKYGTKAYVLGDGIGASVSIQVETGITSVVVATSPSKLLLEDGSRLENEDSTFLLGFDGSGVGYPDNSTITLSDPTGTGAVLHPTFSGGALQSIDIIESGTGYTDPRIVVNGGAHSSGALATAYADRPIKSVTVTAGGSDYVSGYLQLVADGEGAVLTPRFEAAGAVDTLSLVTTGGSYTSTPSISLTDVSNYGAVSSVEITDIGTASYKKIPIATLETKISGDTILATGAELVCVSTSIGGVKDHSFTNFGLDYQEVPLVTYPLVAVIAENGQFITGENIIVESYPYGDPNYALIDLLQESGSHLLTDGDGSLQTAGLNIAYDTELQYTQGPGGIVTGVDFDRHTLYVSQATDEYIFISEDGKVLVQESGLTLANEASNPILPGDVLIGVNSGVRAKVLYLSRAHATAVKTGNAFKEYEALNDSGKLSHSQIKIHNGQRIQDFAYVLTTGLSMNEYETFIKQTVHPAGYKLYGDVEIDSKVALPELAVVFPAPTGGVGAGEGLTLQIFFDPVFMEDAGTFSLISQDETVKWSTKVSDLKALMETSGTWTLDGQVVARTFLETDNGQNLLKTEGGEYLIATPMWHDTGVYAYEETVFPVLQPSMLEGVGFYKSGQFVNNWKFNYSADTPILEFTAYNFNNFDLASGSYLSNQWINGYEGQVETQVHILTEDALGAILTEASDNILDANLIQ